MYHYSSQAFGSKGDIYNHLVGFYCVCHLCGAVENPERSAFYEDMGIYALRVYLRLDVDDELVRTTNESIWWLSLYPS